MIQQARDIYNIDHWSQGYFDINDAGQLVAFPQGSPQASKAPAGKESLQPIVMAELVQQIQQAKLSLPVLIRFTDILRHRLQSLQHAFQQSIQTYHYNNSYTAVYPIKVNQQRPVVEALLKNSGGTGGIGLEAGSKPELMAVMALANRPNFTIICNGYKDREYIRLALIGLQLGHHIVLIIEKRSELQLILEQAAQLKIKPLLGVRARLASVAAGKWQNSGGEKSKFGLSAAEIIKVIETLKESNQLDTLKLLHFHMGSQVSNIRDIHKGLRECARYYAELTKLGVALKAVDVGGGLGIDYEGTRSRSACSINYSLQEYANNVVQAFAEICSEQQLDHPHLITEAGRAMTAHHAVVITNVVEVERVSAPDNLAQVDTSDPQVIKDLWQCYNAIVTQSPNRSAVESYHEACHTLAETQSMFIHGIINLSQRSRAEQIYTALCLALKKQLQQNSRGHQKLLDELNEKLADKLFCNFSLFQSLPDVWAIEQIFPIMPLSGLDQPITHRGIVQDITCDSDGRIDLYIDGESIEKTLPLPSVAPHDHLAIFLVGAYQETLGDMHNLFGDANAVNVELDKTGKYRLVEPEQGDSVDELLKYVHYDTENLLQCYQQQLSQTNLSKELQQFYLSQLQEGMSGYTYLEDS